MKAPCIPVILAGGSGTRLWPVSREDYPKQFCKLTNDLTLLQNTALRAKALCDSEDLIVVTRDIYYFLCQDQLAAIGLSNVHYILEPCSRNTAPAIALAAFYTQAHIDANATLFVMPADHDLQDIQPIQHLLKEARPFVEQGLLILFGITPTAPKTGYGYIKKGEPISPDLFSVEAFIEKPCLQKAQTYLALKQYYWNSGLFLFEAAAYLRELSLCAQDIYQSCEQTFQKTPVNPPFFRVDKSFEACRAGAIDYEIMEKTRHAVIAPVDLTWNDLGSWASVAESLVPDEHNNVLQGDVIASQTKDCFIAADGRQIVTIGINNLIVINTPDAILVADKAYSEAVKPIVDQMKKDQQSIAIKHQRVQRPWGYFDSLLLSKTYQVKYLFIKPGASLSLQSHNHRCEHWTVVDGEAEVVNGQSVYCLEKNQSTYIEKGTKHRLSNRRENPLIIIEVQTGEYLGEDDITRFDDCYDRV